MSVMAAIESNKPRMSRSEVAGLVALAARTVAPLWPLESAIAVNPLSGLEDLPFEEAVTRARTLFGARGSLPLVLWRRLLAAGHIEPKALNDAAIRHLGGVIPASARMARGVCALDMLMARLCDLPTSLSALMPTSLSPDAALLAKWCGAFFDQGQAVSPMPHRALGLYPAVLALLGHDPHYAHLAGEQGARLLLTVPRDPLTAIAEGLDALEIAEDAAKAHLCALVARLPGWAGHIRWRADHADPDVAEGAPATMADLLALWLLLERAGAVAPTQAPSSNGDAWPALAAHFALDETAIAPSGPAADIAHMDEDALGALFMTAAEWTYANRLVPRLQMKATALPEPKPAQAQLVFCIDVRSEPIRRALEQEGPFDTYGYAGFFGLPVALHPHDSATDAARRKRLLPVLLSPRHEVGEKPAEGREALARRLSQASARKRHASRLFTQAKQGSATAFATAEATGPLAGVMMAARTLAPRLVSRLGTALQPDRAQALRPAVAANDPNGFSLADKLGYALTLFRLTGLTTPTARLLVLVGHAGCATNNPYAAALDCGACGGHAGGPNARMLADMLNEPAVRDGLRAHGFHLPPESWAIAAEHNTTTDSFTLFDRWLVPPTHEADLADLEAALARAGKVNRARRAALLGRSADDLCVGAVHWAEVRPEWGLAGNAGFIIGPRRLTQAIDLEGRAFLHSYDWQADTDGSALTAILTAPMVVAQWINGQYLFSTLDNDRYGSGDKVTQNVVGGIGVVQGNGGDLRPGLPRQSLFTDDGTPFHIPQRLLTVVYAPLARVEAVVESHAILARLFGKGWVQLVVIDPLTGRALRWRRDEDDDREGKMPFDCMVGMAKAQAEEQQ